MRRLIGLIFHVLMEVELIEPVLFLGLGNAANRFAEEIARLINGNDAPRLEK